MHKHLERCSKRGGASLWVLMEDYCANDLVTTCLRLKRADPVFILDKNPSR